ncbi:uncharacterized protein BDCG_02081 [Blastomyces dermatitidis ER-3]|uniref:Uncharacterized protein n=2 Tax=Ajellomyces dermatitidis TaxID=5039 RepID=A0A0J9HDL6_AJEDA|nr:uncharacterized protein BDCG_02081 [Blastomyces dermatitidis ER-3]EEQ86961.1 hypothetical protein BDCG_02081 [Blastomyces dermatitidis ER-3]KMW67104.1 hypothetical protein BDDG_11915 [Blastomyces dermatitidis ATCC 18188]
MGEASASTAPAVSTAGKKTSIIRRQKISYMVGGPVAWRSCKQIKLSTEAEYISSSEAAYELVHLRELLGDAGFVLSH